MVFKPNNIQAEPQIYVGSSTIMQSLIPLVLLIQEIEVIFFAVAFGLWLNSKDHILDIHITNSDQAYYAIGNPEKVIQSHKKEEEKNYLLPCKEQQQAFNPFVVSGDGLIEVEAKNILKQLSWQLALKWQKPLTQW